MRKGNRGHSVTESNAHLRHKTGAKIIIAEVMNQCVRRKSIDY